MQKKLKKNISYPEPDKVLTDKPSIKKYLKYILFFGPGAVLVSMTIGQGQLIIGPQIGAWAGLTLLWLITLNIGSYIIAYVGCRFTMLSGISMMDIFAVKTKKGWLNWVFVFIILIFVPLFTAAIINTLGQTVQWIAGQGFPAAWGTLFGIVAVLLVIYGRYRIVEYSQALFVAILGIGAVVSVIAISPNISEILPNFFTIGNVPSYPSWVPASETAKPVALVMLAYLGTLAISLVPIVGYLGWIKVKKWGIFKNRKDPIGFSQNLFDRFSKSGKITYLPDNKEEIKKSRILLKPLLIDLGIAFILVSIISASYMIAGAYLLGPENFPKEGNLLTEQVEIFANIGSWLTPVYQISLFFALFGTIYAGFEAASRMIYETGKTVSKKIHNIDYKKLMLYLMIYILATGIPLAIFGGNMVLLILAITLLFIGVIGVVIYGIAAIYMSQTILPEKYRLGKIALIISIIGVIFMLIPMLFFF